MDSAKKQILILSHYDSFIEAYFEKGLDVKIVNMPFIGSIEGEIAAEKHLEETLPFRFREIYFPVNRRATLMPHKQLPSEIEMAKYELALIEKLKQLQGRKGAAA